MSGRELEGIQHAQDLGKIAPGGHGIGHHQLDVLVRADHKHRAHGGVGLGGAAPGGAGLIGGEHIVEFGDMQIGVGDQGVMHGRAAHIADILEPVVMILDRINAERDDFCVAPREFGLNSGHVAEFGGADRGKVLGVGKQHRPLVADPLVKIDPALGGLGLKIRGLIVDA